MSTINTKKLTILENGTLKNGSVYDIVELAPWHVGDCTALHQAIIDDLPAHQKNYILPKTADYFFTHFAGYNGNAILGVVIDGRLTAQAVSVHPSFRGMGIMNRLVGHWIDHAQNLGREHLLAEIEIHNQASWGTFVTNGLKLVGIGRDPSDGAFVYNAHELTSRAVAKRLTPAFNSAACQIVSAKAFITQEQLFDDGYAIVAWDRDKQVVRMAPQ